jgi:hypothetical protein
MDLVAPLGVYASISNRQNLSSIALIFANADFAYRKVRIDRLHVALYL